MVTSQVSRMMPALKLGKPSVARGAVVRVRFQRQMSVFWMDIE